MAEKKTRLGKGLGALLGEYLETGPDGGGYRTVPVARRIHRNPRHRIAQRRRACFGKIPLLSGR